MWCLLCDKGDVRFGPKNPAFPNHLFVYEVKGSGFCMIVYHHIRQLVAQDFFPKKSEFLGKRQNWICFVFTMLQNTSR